MQTKASWQAHLEQEIARVQKKITILGFELEDDQPHISGDRHLLGGGNKVVLNVSRDGARAVVKASSTREGIAEINEEKRIRDALKSLSFAADSLKIPDELHYGEEDGYAFLITEFIPQKEVLAERPLQERFYMVLRALEAQEAFHATTYEHLQEVRPFMPIFSVDDYLRSIESFKHDAREVPGADARMDEVAALLRENRQLLERYNNYLAHFDFVPHNIRIEGRTIWILDLTNMRLGNKYESWARLINYMLIHDPALAELLLRYVREERDEEETQVLRCMRAFKAALLIAYYARIMSKTADATRELFELRIDLWMNVAHKLVSGAPFPEADSESYIHARDALVSDEEKERKRTYDIN